MHQLVLGIMRKVGVMKETEVFDAETLKTKLIMVSAQLVYTVVTLLPVQLLYTNYVASVSYMVAIYGWCVFQGASQYLEDFQERYKITERQKTK